MADGPYFDDESAIKAKRNGRGRGRKSQLPVKLIRRKAKEGWTARKTAKFIDRSVDEVKAHWPEQREKVKHG